MIQHRMLIHAWLAWDSSGFFEWLAARPWYIQVLKEWVAAIPVERGSEGLEVGCGPGLLTGHLQACGVTMIGLDRSAAMVKRARSNVPQSTFIEGDALSIPLEDDGLDVALAASVVNLVSHPNELLDEMARVVRPGGRVSVLFPTPRLPERVKQITRNRKLAGLSAAALSTWSSKPPKREPAEIETLFKNAGLLDIRVDMFLDQTVASVTGTVATSPS